MYGTAIMLVHIANGMTARRRALGHEGSVVDVPRAAWKRITG
jgi:hypothetical protein